MKKGLKILLGVLICFIVLICSVASYDIATRNNMYSIGDKNLKIPVFVYHDIVEDKSHVLYDYMQTPKDVFEDQISGLQKLGYKFITYEELEKYKKGEIKLSKKSCILTFDDGYEGVYKYAYPIAKKYDVPFTMFVITDTVEKKSDTITWEQAKEMYDSGLVTIASHSTNHPEFTDLSVEDAVDNVNESYRIIEEHLGEQKTKIFTYPYGLYTEEQVNALEKEGYIQNLTDNKINKSKSLDLSRLHRCYPLSDSIFKMILKIIYRSIRYN